MQRRVLIGRVVGVFGVRGEVKIESFTEPRDALFRYQPWQLNHRGAESTVSGARGKGSGHGAIIGKLPGIETRDDAERLLGAEIWVPRDQLAPTKPGEYYWIDLEGLAVSTVEGVALGTVSHLFSTGVNDVIVVTGERDRYLPYSADVVRSVDLAGGRMTVDWDPDF